MDNKIPVPTDNIFKFYALFSLLLLVFAFGSMLYINRSTNEQAMSLFVDIETLKQEKLLTQPQQLRKAILERQLEILKSDKLFFRWGLAILAAFGILGMIYGFKKWHLEVQPVIDETAKIQLKIAKLQLEKLEAEIAKNNL